MPDGAGAPSGRTPIAADSASMVDATTELGALTFWRVNHQVRLPPSAWLSFVSRS